MKSSAIDYLVEYVNSEKEVKWLRSVVACYLNSKENISDVELQRLSDELLTNSIQDCSLNSFMPISNSSNMIKIKKLRHESGVNALSNEQEIVFNDQINVLYGLNGSGKSSYFRILQAMIGNIDSSDIIPNIYLDDIQNINATLEYSLDTTLLNIPWNNNGEINDLKTVKVFDSKYSQNFLGKRESDEQLLYPYKLYVFSDISKYIDQIKDIAKKQLDERKENILAPRTDKFAENEKKIFEREVTHQDKVQLNTISTSYNSKKESELIAIQAEIKSLMETNFNDKFKLVESKDKQCKAVKKRVEEVLLSWIKTSEEYREQYNSYEQYKKESEENRRQIAILSGLPGVDSHEWKDFIKNGLLISSKSEELSDTCPYCHRKYDESAVAIVQAYSIFIQDKTEEKLSGCKSKIIDIINRAKHTKIVDSDYLFDGSEELQSQIMMLVQKVKEYVDALKLIENSLQGIDSIDCETLMIEKAIDELLKKYSDEFIKIKEDESKKEENLMKKTEIENELVSQKSICEQIDVINKFIDGHLALHELRQRVNSISSNKITRISKTAHEELLTNQLMKKFDEFLEEFKIMGREIELLGKTNKGVQQTELVMKSKKNVTKILSEGEQKAVSIALFLAEISVAQNKSTVILDDPVNSFDHRMMECLSNILFQLDNQIIIFTHNRMFLDSVFGSDYGHKCKNYQPHGCNNSKGKHIFIFQIKSEGLNEAGVITSRIKDNARGYLDDVKDLFGQSPFSEELKVCALLRNAIDHLIDEVVFNGQTPRKYSMKGVAQSVAWDELKRMASDSNMIDDLKRIFGRVSSGQLHIGQASSNNSPDKMELMRLYDELDKMLP